MALLHIVLRPDPGSAFPHLRRGHEQWYPRVCCTQIAPGDGTPQGSTGGPSIGIQDCAGTLAPGQWADLILVQGNPLDDIRVLQSAEHITCVLKAGQIVKGIAAL